MASRIVARRDPRDVALHLHLTLLLRGNIANNRPQLLYRKLYLREPALQRSHLLHQAAPLFVQLLHIFRHLLQLFDARLVIAAVDIHCLEHLVQMLDHRMEASTQRAAAGRALTIFAECDDTIALVFELRVLLPQRLALGLRFLSIAHPLGATRLEQSMRVL